MIYFIVFVDIYRLKFFSFTSSSFLKLVSKGFQMHHRTFANKRHCITFCFAHDVVMEWYNFFLHTARLSGERLRKLEDLEPESSSDNLTGRAGSGFFSSLKFHTFLHFQKFNFWTILLFASVSSSLSLSLFMHSR